MACRLEDLIAAYPWRKAVFTTYALSLSFFESVLLDGLVRGGSKEALILADPQGVRTGLSEQGAQRVGRDYELEPVAVSTGAFHPKITALIADDDCHLVVGSGNLTFNGWGGNFELAEHLHPSFAADAFDDAGAFFRLLAESPKAAHGLSDNCLALSEDLSRAAAGKPHNGAIRILHSLDGAIGARLAEFADELGGALRLTAVAPFWDSGTAIDRLCQSLGLDVVHLHAHPGGSVQGQVGSNWPASPQVEVIPIAVPELSAGNDRKLHAKTFEILCRHGRLIMSGSANATSAALAAGNVEAGVLRIQRDRLQGWTLEPASAPLPQPALDDEAAENEARPGVLRARVAGDRIQGRVLAPALTGPAWLFRITSEGVTLLGETTLDSEGAFEISLPGFEVEALRGSRVILRIDCGGRLAEGFASLVAATQLRRITGKAAPSMFALFAGSETPEDVRILVEWIHDHPDILTPSPGQGRQDGTPQGSKPSSIDHRHLWKTQGPQVPVEHAGDEHGWKTLINALFSAFRDARGPIERNPDPEDQNGQAKRGRAQPKKALFSTPKLFETFERLLDHSLRAGAAHEAVLRVFYLAAYICERLTGEIPPEKARSWLRQIVTAFCASPPPAMQLGPVPAAIMALCGSDPDLEEVRAARARLLRVGGVPGGRLPSDEPVKSFRAAMEDTRSYEQSWQRIQEIRTWREQVRAYCETAIDGRPGADFQELLDALPREAPLLNAALASERARSALIVLKSWQPTCSCHIQLPTGEQSRLRAFGVAMALNCCRKVLLWPEGADG